MSPSTDRNLPFIPFAKPSIGATEEQAVLDVLRSGWLTTASKAEAFEQAFSRRVGVPHALAVNSGTAGLHLALEALGITAGDRVATTTYTFTATAETIRYLGADPVFIDIAPDGYNLDVEQLERVAHTERIDAFLPVHVAGRPCPMDEITALAHRIGIAVVEDAAHAFPSEAPWGIAGAAADAGVYSFYANKPITTGEGGMVATRDRTVAERIRTMRLHGIDRDVWDRYTNDRPRSWEYDIVAPGFKYNMPDTAAAIGLVQLARADAFLERRREISRRYREAFADRCYLETPDDQVGHAWHLFILALRLDLLDLDRDAFAEELRAAGIGTSVHYKPLHLMRYYRKRYDLAPDDFPRATDRFQRVLSLPIYPDLDDGEVDRVIRAILKIGDRAYHAR